MRERLLRFIGRQAADHSTRMLVMIILITVILGALASTLRMDMNLTGLLPKGDPMVEEFNKIYDKFNGANTAFIVVKGDMDQMISYAETISPMVEHLESWLDENASLKVKKAHEALQKRMTDANRKRYYDRVDFKQPVDFMKQHGLMLISPDDLKNTKNIFTNPNILPFVTNLNNSLEREYIQSETKISTSQKERNAVTWLDGIETWTDALNRALLNDTYSPKTGGEAADAVSVGIPYLVSPDRSMLIIVVTPNFNIMNTEFYAPAISGLEEMVKSTAKDFNVDAGLTGSIVLGRDEMDSATEDSMILTLIALIAILILFVVTFRMVAAPLLAGVNLIIGVTWAMGITWFLVDSLNMFTAMMAVILVGLGIDYSIHVISVFSEQVLKGTAPREAIILTLEKVGTGIITGAFTTAAAFLTLVIARSAGIKEFGLVNGIGLLTIMFATLITMPTLLMLRERYRTWRGKSIAVTRDVSYQTVGAIAEFVYNKRYFSIAAIVLLTLILGFYTTHLTMDYNYLNMEPVGLESISLNDEIIAKFNMSSDLTMMTASSLAENATFTDEAKKKSSISYLESITDYIPEQGDQENRQHSIVEIQKTMTAKSTGNNLQPSEVYVFIDELRRLEANIMEMQDMAFMGGQDMVDAKCTRLVGSPDKPESIGNLSALIASLDEQPEFPLDRLNRFNKDFSSDYKQVVLSMANPEPITLDMLPPMIHDKYISSDGKTYLITVYPKGNVCNIEYLETFAREVLEVSPAIAGTPPMFYYLLKIIGADGKKALIYTVLVVFLLLLYDFRSLKYTLITMAPLVFGIIWMTGLMGATGLPITLLNITAIPLIVGIGIDDGVHIVHRFRIENETNIRTVFSSTGKAVIITSLTTMLSFGSLVFATYRGFGSMGLALFIGVGMCLIASLIVLPALLRFFK